MWAKLLSHPAVMERVLEMGSSIIKAGTNWLSSKTDNKDK